MKIQENALLINKVSTEYEFDGRKGTSNKARLLIGTEIFALSFRTDDELELFHRLPEDGTRINVVLELTSPKEDIRLKMLDFD